MKKKYHLKTLIILFVMLGVLTACRHLVMEPSPYAETELNQSKDIHFRTIKKTIQADEKKMDVEVVNESDETIGYGIEFTLEKLQEKEWMEVQPDDEIAFIAIGLLVEPGERGQDTIELEHYPVLPEGTYRIVRMIQGQTYTAEFKKK